MLTRLAWQDYAVIAVYLTGMLVLGALLARRQKTDEEYFLGGRRMPWFAVGVSVIASLLSSLTYLSEPGEVWNSGVTHVLGKMLAIPVEMAIVWLLCIPLMMRMRYTSAYEYLGDRFGPAARRLGVALFLLLVVLWMGFVVLASSRALAQVSGVPLLAVIVTVGLVATVYTMLGGLRAVIWTDVVQVALLIGGGLFAIGYVMLATGSLPPQWLAASQEHLARPPTAELGVESPLLTVSAAAAGKPREPTPWFSFSPFTRATIITVAINMCVWHVCTHTANQMTVQRYFSTSSLRAARRSFVTGSLFGVGLNLMLVVVGLAVLYYYLWLQRQQGSESIPLDNGLKPWSKDDRDLIFTTFAVNRLPPGLGGAVLAALLAAAMSSIDSGVNSIATVVSVEWRGQARPGGGRRDHVARAMAITLLAGGFITLAAYALNFLPADLGIVESMPRTFNAVTAPLGGLFLAGFFLPRVGQRAVVAGASLGMLTSLGIGYFDVIVESLSAAGVLSATRLDSIGLLDAEGSVRAISFTWVMPLSLAVTLLFSWLISLALPREKT